MEKTKICSVCHVEKPLSEYYKQSDRKNGASRCKTCFNKYCVERSIKKKIDAIIHKGSSCLDCGVSYPQSPYVIFDFHHHNPSEKEFDWSKMRSVSKQKLYDELDKCDLLCSNCHRIRHYNEP